MLAGITKTPELALEQSEAKTIAEATAKVAAFYDFSADPKTIAWCNLAMTLGTVYGTRFVAIRMRKKTVKESRKEKVVPINGTPVNGIPIGPGKLPPFDGGHGPQ